MAQRPIRESQAKALLCEYWPEDDVYKPSIRFAPVSPDTDLQHLAQEHHWLTTEKLVIKADELFGKRGKRGYVKIAESFEEAKKWIQEHRGQTIDIDGKKGVLNHFIIEPFIEHDEEYFIAIEPSRTKNVILFSDQGGVDVEEQQSLTRIEVALGEEPDLSSLPSALHPAVKGLLTVYRELDFGSIEINPVTVIDGKPFLLDCVARLDSCAHFRQKSRWKDMEIPDGFGSSLTKEEQFIRSLDEKSGSSLKFVLLHPEGRIWTMVAGGGASIIYADAIVRQVPAHELANYGEWSGNPSTDEMAAYTETILDLIAQKNTEQVLIIGGGIANFTDVKKTFAGVIQALEKKRPELRNLKIFVRRAGPRDKEGLQNLQEACDKLSLPCRTYDATLPMTDIVSMAIQSIHNLDSPLKVNT